MTLLNIIAVCSTFASVLFNNSAASVVSASVYFYTDVNFGGTLFPVDVNKSKKCYSLCAFKEASSVEWMGQIATHGNIDGKTHIAFYTEKNCIGPHIHFPINYELNSRGKIVLLNSTINDLDKFDSNDDISSFMIWETSENIEKGRQMDCPWVL